MLHGFRIDPHNIRSGKIVRRGYHLRHFGDAFTRYLPPIPQGAATNATTATSQVTRLPDVAENRDVAAVVDVAPPQRVGEDTYISEPEALAENTRDADDARDGGYPAETTMRHHDSPQRVPVNHRARAHRDYPQWSAWQQGRVPMPFGKDIPDFCIGCGAPVDRYDANLRPWCEPHFPLLERVRAGPQ